MLAHHLIFGAYGFWLPNDPRGSWSDFVGSWELFRFGRATKTVETCSLARRSHDRGLRLAAKAALKRPAVNFNGLQARAVARGFAAYVQRSALPIYACAVMPDHVHLVVAQRRLDPHRLTIQLKGAATERLSEEGIHPFQSDVRPPKCFARGEWKVYLDTIEEIHRAIRYVNQNPIKEGLPPQNWSFITPFDDR